MRKISIGIFAVLTVILFFLSTSISVTAATHQEKLIELESKVWSENPYAQVTMSPQDVWSYSNWNWTLDINNGDNVYIDTKCIWANGNPWAPDSGKHFYLADGTYIKGATQIQDDDDHEEWTDGEDEEGWETGDITLTLQFNNVEEGGTIYLFWSVYALNIAPNPDVEVENWHNGTVKLT